MYLKVMLTLLVILEAAADASERVENAVALTLDTSPAAF